MSAQLCVIQPHNLSYITSFVDTGAPVGFALSASLLLSLPASPSDINKCALDKQVFCYIVIYSSNNKFKCNP
jgi:hypothetical protein